MKCINIAHLDIENDEQVAEAFEALAEGKIIREDMGICYNLSELFRSQSESVWGVGHDICRNLFRAINEDADDYPFQVTPRDDNWEMRKRWCSAFAVAMYTQVIIIDEEMEDFLKLPVDTKHMIR